MKQSKPIKKKWNFRLKTKHNRYEKLGGRVQKAKLTSQQNVTVRWKRRAKQQHRNRDLIEAFEWISWSIRLMKLRLKLTNGLGLIDGSVDEFERQCLQFGGSFNDRRTNFVLIFFLEDKIKINNTINFRMLFFFLFCKKKIIFWVYYTPLPSKILEIQSPPLLC